MFFKRLLLIITILSISLIFYAYSFNDVEIVCKENTKVEIYLLNYITKKDLKSIVYSHNADFEFKGDELKRLYLLRNIFEIPDPIWNSKIDYKKEGCKNIDNMDIYCEVRYQKMKNGEIDIWYNFMD